jgi:hypothetical protein
MVINMIEVMNDFSSPKYDEHRVAIRNCVIKEETGILLNITAAG